MARKKEDILTAKKEQVILESLPATGALWIKQPVPLSLLNGKFSKYQIICIGEIMDALQVKVEDALRKADWKEKKPLLIFPSDKSIVEFSIPLSSMSVPPNRYDILAAAANELSKMQMTQYIKGTEEIGDTLRFLNIFRFLDIPTVVSEDGKKKYRKELQVGIYTEDIQAFLDVSHYNSYLKSVLTECDSTYSSRLYVFLTVYRDFGMWEVSYSRFRVMLGLDEISNVKINVKQAVYDASDLTIVDFPYFSDVKRFVLDVAEKELKKLAAAGKIDCYFDYEAIYSHPGQRRGDPDKLRFNIHLTKMGKERQEASEAYLKWVETENILKRDLCLGSTDVGRLRNAIDSDVLMREFASKVRSLATFLADPKHKVQSKSAYSISVLKEWLSEWKNKGKEEDSQAEPQAPSPVPHAQPMNNKQKWQQVLCDCRQEMTDEELEQISHLNFCSCFDDGALTLRCSDKAFCDSFFAEGNTACDKLMEICNKYYNYSKLSLAK